MTHRIEVRNKKEIFDIVAENLKRDIKDIGIKDVTGTEYIEVYTVTGDISSDDALRIADVLLTDKVSQEFNVTGGFMPSKKGNAATIEIAYNPGVMDPVEESAIKAINDLGINSVQSVKTYKKYIVYGRISKNDLNTISDKLLYNKIIQHVVVHDEPPKTMPAYEFRAVEIDISRLNDTELLSLSKKGQLYLSLQEMKAIQAYFKELRRNPTDCELETIAQTWSEHCKHKTMMGDVSYEGKIIKNLLKETVMKVTRDLDKPWCVSVFKDNAGIIKFDKNNNICFKVETHNHPSALEPYGGAETGVGGVIRDCLGTGRGAKPIANTDVFCFGIPDVKMSSVPKGALHPKRVLKGVVGGVRDYGNKMGIPTVNGAVYFDERYTGNPLVFCGNIGIMPHKFSDKKVSPGDLIVAIGGKTGRDGIHGATFSSAELTTESESISSTAVQIGNPITEKKMVDTLMKARDEELYDAITDCGAGGFSSAVGEMGEETGALVSLEKVPLKYEGLKPWEIWVSEAQERMVLAVKPDKLERLMRIFANENVEATVIGKFTGDKRLRIFYKDHQVADIDMAFIHDGIPRATRNAVWKKVKEEKNITVKNKTSPGDNLRKMLSNWNICSKEWIIRQYDHEVQGGSVLKPLVGAENDGPSDASIIRPLLNSWKGVIIANGINPRYGDIDPYWMAASAIDEALRQVTAVGGNIAKTALLDNFCWGNTDKPEQLGGLVRASQACYDMASVFKTPFISGKDSLNNEFNAGHKTISIPPTLLISAISIVDDVRKTISADIKEAGNLIYIIGTTFDELGGSQYFLVNGIKGGVVPKVNPANSLRIMGKLHAAINAGLVKACHDPSDGGIAVALAEMLFSGGYGAEISLSHVPVSGTSKRDDIVLFSESNSRFLAEVPLKKKKTFEKIIKGVPFALIGHVTRNKQLVIRDLKEKVMIKEEIDHLKKCWKKPLQEVMHEKS